MTYTENLRWSKIAIYGWYLSDKTTLRGPWAVISSTRVFFSAWGIHGLDQLLWERGLKWDYVLTFLFSGEEGLRAPDQKYRESHDRKEISSSILFYQKYPFGKLFSKIIFKSSSAFCFFLKFR